jgi:suppressor of G2 allele of SKP1
MASQAAAAQTALDAKDYDKAISLYTEALKTSNSPLWLIQRSTAYQRKGDHELALKDAEAGVHAAIARAKRELIGEAQFRRGVALYSMRRLGDSRMCFNFCRSKYEKMTGLGMWQKKVSDEYEKLPEGDKARLVTVQEIPDLAPKEQTQSAAKENKADEPKSTVAAAPSVAQTPKEKIRHEWYQSGQKVTITIFAKGVPKDKAEIHIEPRSVSLPIALFMIYSNICSLMSASQLPQIALSTTPSLRSSPRSIQLRAPSLLRPTKLRSYFTRQ